MQRSPVFLLTAFVSLASSYAFAESKPLRIAGFYSEPYVTESEEHPGFLYEIVQNVFAFTKTEAKFSIFPKKRSEHNVNTRQADALFPVLNNEPKLYIYSEPLFVVHEALLEREDKPLSKTQSLSAMKKPGDFTWDTDSVFNTIDMVNSGRRRVARIDPYVTAEALLGKRSPLIPNLKITQQGSETSYHLAFLKDNPNAEGWLKTFNEGLQKLKSEGKLEPILEKYGYQNLVRSPTIAHIAVPDFYDVRILKDLSREYLKEKPGLEFRWYLMDENLLRKRVSSSLVLKELGFDAFGLEPGELFIHRGVGPLQAFDDDLAKALKADDLFPPLRYGIEFEKKYYAVPYRGYSNVTFYRKDLFAAKKLKMPASPTFQQLTEFAKVVDDPDRGVAGFCMRATSGINENMALLRNLLASADDEALATILQPDINNPTWTSVVKRYTDVLLQYGPDRPSTLGYAENLANFKEGRCAIWPDISVAAGEIFDPKISKVADKTAITDPPYFDIDEEKRLVSYRTIAVSAYTDKKRPLEEFLVWTLSPAYQDALVRKYGWIHLPLGIRPSLFENPEYRKAAPFAADILHSFQKYKFKNPVLIDPVVVRAVKEYYGIWPTFSDIVGKNINEVLQKKKTVTMAMQDSQRRTKAVYYQSRNQNQK